MKNDNFGLVITCIAVMVMVWIMASKFDELRWFLQIGDLKFGIEGTGKAGDDPSLEAGGPLVLEGK